MKIEVRLFATLRENRDKIMAMDLVEGTTSRDIIAKLDIAAEEAAILLINGRHGSLDSPLKDKDVVSIFPPVGGG